MCQFQTVLSKIAAADSRELSEIVRATLERYRALFPEEEVLFLSLPLDDQEERAEILRRAVELSEQYE